MNNTHTLQNIADDLIRDGIKDLSYDKIDYEYPERVFDSMKEYVGEWLFMHTHTLSDKSVDEQNDLIWEYTHILHIYFFG